MVAQLTGVGGCIGHTVESLLCNMKHIDSARHWKEKFFCASCSERRL